MRALPNSFAARTLVIDSATEACSAALFEGNTLIEGTWRMLGRGHAEQLVPMIAALPERGRAGRIAVALGPGSFTGVRVGIAAARALALAWGSNLVGYSTPELVAAMALAQAPSGTPDVAVAMTGGHGEWFVQAFDGQGAALGPVASTPPAQAVINTPQALVAGSQAEALVAARAHGNAHRVGMALPLWPDARAFPALAPERLRSDVAPIYGRGPDALLPGGRRPAESAAAPA